MFIWIYPCGIWFYRCSTNRFVFRSCCVVVRNSDKAYLTPVTSVWQPRWPGLLPSPARHVPYLSWSCRRMIPVRDANRTFQNLFWKVRERTPPRFESNYKAILNFIKLHNRAVPFIEYGNQFVICISK